MTVHTLRHCERSEAIQSPFLFFIAVDRKILNIFPE